MWNLQSREKERERPTRPPYSRLLANNHTLQYLCALERPQIFRDVSYAIVLEGMAPESRIENSEGMTYLVDGLCWWNR